MNLDTLDLTRSELYRNGFPHDVFTALREQAPVSPCLLIDCMSLWLSNLLHAGEERYQKERDDFLETLVEYPGPVVIVSNEVGLGIIGMDPLTRRFGDELGWLNQALAQRCQNVRLVVAGLSLDLKSAT